MSKYEDKLNNRRDFIKKAGLGMLVPAFLKHGLINQAHANSNLPRLVTIFFPDGSYMPNPTQDNGWWTVNGALRPLNSNVIGKYLTVPRGIQNGKFRGQDQHWSGCAGWLSASNPRTGSSSQLTCGRSMDQIIAHQMSNLPQSLSIGIGEREFSEHASTHGAGYLNSTSWRSANAPIKNLVGNRTVFDELFDGVSQGPRPDLTKLQPKAVVDHFLVQINQMKTQLINNDEKQRFDRYLTSVEEIEKKLDIVDPKPGACGAPARPNEHDLFAGRNPYMNYWRTMHDIVVAGFECDQTRVVNMMYDNGVGGIGPSPKNVRYGTKYQIHPAAHWANGDTPNRIQSQKDINLVHMNLVADLINKLESKNMMRDTIIMVGSCMSNGNEHDYRNLPLALISGHNRIKKGSIGRPNTPIKLSNVHKDIMSLFGIQNTAIGEGDNRSDSRASGILT